MLMSQFKSFKVTRDLRRALQMCAIINSVPLSNESH